MRIRKRWPAPALAQALAPADRSSSGLQRHSVVEAAPPALLLQQSTESRGGVLVHSNGNVSVEPNERLSPPCNSRNPCLLRGDRRGPDLVELVRRDDGGEEEDEKIEGSDCMSRRISSETAEDPRDGVAGEDEDKILAANNRRRKESFSGAKACDGIISVSSSSSSHQQVLLGDTGRWCKGERMFPLKKRSSRGARLLLQETIVMQEEEEEKKIIKMKTRVKARTNTCGTSTSTTTAVIKKRRGSSTTDGGGAIMEGSRCSRVNGRGWRCSQQTLVGYSLCEHHLGKGRLRSMSSVRCRAGTTATYKPKKEEEIEEEGSLLSYLPRKKDGEEEEKPLMNSMKKMKKKKIGMVKARSLNSLLGQTQHATMVSSTTDEHHLQPPPPPPPPQQQPPCDNSNNANHNVMV